MRADTSPRSGSSYAASQVPSSRRAVESGQLCRRKTMAEVDLNRNWATAWRADAGRGEDEYGGAQPFSEPQSQALRQLAQQLLPTAYANVHSGEWAVYVPWDHKRALALGLPTDTPQLLEQLNTHCKCTRGAGGAASNYLAYGTSMDWMWQGARGRNRGRVRLFLHTGEWSTHARASPRRAACAVLPDLRAVRQQ